MAPPPATEAVSGVSDRLNSSDDDSDSTSKVPTTNGDADVIMSVNRGSCWYKFRRSRALVILIVFIAMTLDLMLITCVEPILPPLVYSVMQPNASERFLDEIFNFRPPDIDHRIKMIPSIKRRHVTINFNNSNFANFSFDPNLLGYNNSDLDYDDTAVENQTVDPYLDYVFEMSTLFSLKPASEIFSNIVSGLIVNRYGHRKPLLIGCMSTFVATLGFAFSPWYWMLAVTRVVQALGSSLSVVAGLALLTCVFTDDAERTRANSLAYDGLTLGLLLGMPFGSTMYNFAGRQAPFLILALLVLLDLILRCLYIDKTKHEPPHASRSAKEALREARSIYWNLLSNADVSIALLTSFIINGALGALMSSAPAFLLDKYNADQWEIGVILVCGAAAQLSSQTFTGFVLSNHVRPWILSTTGFFLYGVALMAYTYPPNLWLVIIPECIGRIGLGLFTCIITPLLARIVDVYFQDAANYGAIFGLYVASYNLGLALGPLVTAVIVDTMGARMTYWIIGAIVMIVGLFNIRFRRPLIPKVPTPPESQQPVDEHQPLLSSSKNQQKYVENVQKGRSFSTTINVNRVHDASNFQSNSVPRTIELPV